MTDDPPQQKPRKPKASLGLVELPERTFEHDHKIAEGYQSFSAELLRLSLAGLAVVGFLVTKMLAPPENQPPVPLPACLKVMLGIAIGSLAVAAGLALLHRYYATDSLANHLQLMRSLEAGRALSSSGRQIGFALSTFLLVGSSVSLWLGAVFLGIAFIMALP